MKKSIAIIVFSIVSLAAFIIVALKMFVFTPIYTINQLQSAISNLDTALFLEYAKFHQSKDDDTTPHYDPNSANEWETFDYVMESSAKKMQNADFEIRDFRTYLPADSEIIKHSYTKNEQGAIVRIYSRDKYYYNIPMYSEIHMQRFGWKYIAVSRNRNASLTRSELIVAASSRYRADATFRPLIVISAKKNSTNQFIRSAIKNRCQIHHFCKKHFKRNHTQRRVFAATKIPPIQLDYRIY